MRGWARIGVLGGAIAATIGLTVFYAPPDSEYLWLGLVAAIILAVTYIFLRHIGLALFAVFTPFAGLIWSGTLLTIAHLGILDLVAQSLLLIFSATLSLFTASAFARRTANGASADTATREAVGSLLRPATVVLALCVLAATVSMVQMNAFALTGIASAIMLLCSGAVTLGLAFLALPSLTYTEEFVARWNRAQERWSRLLARIALVTQSRWALSFSGIALVFVTLGLFGSQSVTLGVRPHVWAIIAGAVFVAGLVVTRNWRIASALLLAMLPPAALCLWTLFKMNVNLDTHLWTVIILVLSILAYPLFLIAYCASQYNHGELRVAFEQTVDEQGGVTVSSAIVSSLVLGSLIVVREPTAIALVFLAAATGVAAILFLPAFAVAIETIIPRRRSVEEIYKTSG